MDSQFSFQDLADAVVAFLQRLMESVQHVYESLPSVWPMPLRIVVIIIFVAVFISLIRLLLILIVKFPRYLIMVSWLRFTSPYGRSSWASLKDIRKANMLKPGGIYLGQFRTWYGRCIDLYHHGEGHLITIAAPGAGKTSSILVPVLLNAPKGNSFIVSDPKGEITAMTARDQEAKRKVFYLNPFFQDFKDATGLDYKDSGFNPFDFIDDNENIKNQSDILARYLCVTDRKPSSDYFSDEGMELLSLFIAWIVRYEKPEDRNLSFLYRLLRADPIAAVEMIAASGDEHILYDGQGYSNIAKVKPQWEGVVSKAKLATKRYIPNTPLATHTSKCGFDPRSLKKEDVTVYVLLPTQHLKTNASWLNMVMGLIGESIGKAGKARPVTMLLDELPAMGFLPDLRSQMEQLRGSGLRCWLFAQSSDALSDESMYGEKGFNAILASCDIKQFFHIRLYDFAQAISNFCGKIGRYKRSLDRDGNSSMGLEEVPLVRPESILRLKRNEQLLVYRSENPIKGRLLPYYKRKNWLKRTDPNPFIG